MFCFGKKLKPATKISEARATELVEDRIEFKLYYANQHYHKLLRLRHEDGSEFLKTFASRVAFEDELECLLAHLIGAKDALLMLLNDKLNLSIGDEDVRESTVYEKLSDKDKRLLCGFKSVNRDGFWFQHLNELRNTGIHRRIVPINKSITLYENLGSNTASNSEWSINFFFKDGETVDLISFLEFCLRQMKILIDNVLAKEPVLMK